MAPRKAKHLDTEIVDKATEAGDATPPKRKRAMPKNTQITDEKKEIRFPRVAKTVGRNEQIKLTNAASAQNTRTKKTLPAKDVSDPIKTNSKRKNSEGKKNVAEIDMNSLNTEIAENIEENIDETETKKSGAKAAKKKAGTDEELKTKPEGRAKKTIFTKSTKDSQSAVAKKKREINTEVTLEENNLKTKSNNKKKAGGVNETDIDVNKTEKSDTAEKRNKNVNDDKSTKPTARRTKKGKNESSPESTSKDEESKIADVLSSEAVGTSHIDNQEVQTNWTETLESVKVSKKGKNLQRKEATVTEKKHNKSRGKGNANVDNVNNKENTLQQ